MSLKALLVMEGEKGQVRQETESGSRTPVGGMERMYLEGVFVLRNVKV